MKNRKPDKSKEEKSVIATRLALFVWIHFVVFLLVWIGDYPDHMLPFKGRQILLTISAFSSVLIVCFFFYLFLACSFFSLRLSGLLFMITSLVLEVLILFILDGLILFLLCVLFLLLPPLLAGLRFFHLEKILNKSNQRFHSIADSARSK